MRLQSLGREDPLEEGMATHSSILAWRIPWTAEPGGVWSIGLQSPLLLCLSQACGRSGETAGWVKDKYDLRGMGG